MIHKHILKFLTVCVALITLVLTAPQAVQACGGGVICVNVDAAGLSWTDAFTNVQDALAGAAYSDEIWVAKGVYYPDLGAGQKNNSLTATFTLRPGVALYGGFAATETLLTERDWAAHITVLSGDIDGKDVTDAHGVVTDTNNIAGDNAWHATTGGGVTETARRDGFTITAGDAYYHLKDGSGMYNLLSSPTLSNLTFSGNRARFGGGMYNENSHPTLTNIIFSKNQAYWDGGGIYNSKSDLQMDNVTFSSNQVS